MAILGGGGAVGPCPTQIFGSQVFFHDFTFKFVWLTCTADNFQPAKFWTISQKPSSLHSIFSKCKISCVVVFDGRETRVIYDDTHQWFLRICMKFSQTAVVVMKNSIWHQEIVSEMGRLFWNAFQCEVELDYITVSKLCLVPVAKGLWKRYELVSVNLSWLQVCVLLPCATSKHLDWFVISLWSLVYPHMCFNPEELCKD